MDLCGRNDLVREQHVGYARLDECCRFIGLLAANADSAAGELQSRDIRALVRLRMRPQPNPAGRFRHAVEVAFEGVEVDNERRRFDGNHGVAGLCGRTLRHSRIVARPAPGGQGRCDKMRIT